MTDDSAGDIVTFRPIARSRRIVALLGVVHVGEVVTPVADGGAAAAWRTFLPDLPMTWRGARDADDAKARLQDAVKQWIDAAGLALASDRSTAIRAFRQPARECRRVPA